MQTGGAKHNGDPNEDTEGAANPKLEDWTEVLPVTEGTKFFKSIDWSTSTLGLPQTWHATLRFAVSLLLSDSRGAAIYWGDERVAIYNEVYQPMAGQAHPKLMGKPFRVGYPELCDSISPIFEQVHATGITIDVENIELFTDRHGYTEETYFIGQFIPLRGEDGRTLGVYNTVYENTFSVIQMRRRDMINEIAAIPDCDLKQSNHLIHQVLQTNGRDMPMAMLYSLDEGTPTSAQKLQLRLNIGVKTPDLWVPMLADIAASDVGIVPYFRTVYERKTMVVLRADDLASDHFIPLLEDVDWTGFGEPSNVLIVAPLTSAGNISGFMLMGTNPRRDFTDQSRQFATDVTSQIAAKWASAFTMEQSRAREERLIRNLEERERRIRYMAESAPVGMLQLTTEGSIAWANQHYFNIMTDLPDNESDEHPFVECFFEDDQPTIRHLWETLKGGTSANCQARLRRTYQPPNHPECPNSSTEVFQRWILVQGFPLKDEDELKLIMMCFTDISGPKWAESVQLQVAAAAEKSKRQQEEFIDITSHEMRNPLSAIMQSAQAISASLQSLRASLDPVELLRNVEEAIEASETILSCGVYQKRIIDDVLMLSRLENEMLSITPAIVDPMVLAKNTLKMLEGDARSGKIKTTLIRQESLAEHKIGNIFCDPSRLAQILTNLLSNAFKFTRNQKTRLTEVTCGVSPQIPTEEKSMRTLQWSSTGKDRGDLTVHPEWGSGEVIYLYFLIRDTGCGMSPQETEHLFTRFSQATSKTHINYGGSGLGLYISRELTEKHGGQIGVRSEPGQGSTFAFYVKGRRAPTMLQPPLESSCAIAGSPELANLSDKFQLSLQQEERFEVLLVEDNLINQRVLARQLRKAGCIVHTANDGVEALGLLEKADQRVINGTSKGQPGFDVVLMDWNMPNLDGVSCTRRIRTDEHDKQIKQPMVIIGITANARPEQLMEAREAGMDAVLSKPFLLADLMAQIRILVRK